MASKILFDTSPFEQKTAIGCKEILGKEEVKWSNKSDTMKNSIGELEKGKVIHFVTNYGWSFYELLEYLLNQVGASDVDCFTWNVSLPAVRSFSRQIERGLIKRFRFLCHSVMRSFSAEAIAVLMNMADCVVLFPNHAKGFLLSNENWKVSVIGSANFSNNTQIEGGTISCDPGVWEMHKKWLNPIYEKKELLASNNLEAREMPVDEVGEDIPTLFIVRGLPGAGKTAMAKAIADESYENDQYMTVDSDGKYKFDANEARYAAAQCYASVKNAFERGVSKVAVSNTFVDDKSVERYLELAAVYGYRVHTVVVENRHGGLNVHGVDEDKIEAMRKRFKVRL